MKPINKQTESLLGAQNCALGKCACAVSLGGLSKRGVANISYRDMSKFDKLADKTHNLAYALEARCAGMCKGQSNRLQIKTSLGGETHYMIAKHRMCWDRDTILPVINAINLDMSNKATWHKVERELGGKIAIMSGKVAPGGAPIPNLLGHPRALLISIGGIAHHVGGFQNVGMLHGRISTGVNVGFSNLAIQTVNFLQTLFNKVSQMSGVSMLINITGQDQALGKKYYEPMRRLAGLQGRVITAVTDDGALCVIYRRLLGTNKMSSNQYASNGRRQTDD